MTSLVSLTGRNQTPTAQTSFWPFKIRTRPDFRSPLYYQFKEAIIDDWLFYLVKRSSLIKSHDQILNPYTLSVWILNVSNSGDPFSDDYCIQLIHTPLYFGHDFGRSFYWLHKAVLLMLKFKKYWLFKALRAFAVCANHDAIALNSLSTWSRVIPSYQGDSIIFHIEKFLQLQGIVLTHPPFC